MAVSGIVVRAGVGSWTDIPHLVLRGLDIGQAAQEEQVFHLGGGKRGFIGGDYLVQCDFSGFTVYASETVETWDGKIVAKRFVGSEARRHPQDFVRGRVDDQRVPKPRKPPAVSFLEPGDVTAEDL